MNLSIKAEKLQTVNPDPVSDGEENSSSSFSFPSGLVPSIRGDSESFQSEKREIHYPTSLAIQQNYADVYSDIYYPEDDSSSSDFDEESES